MQYPLPHPIGAYRVIDSLASKLGEHWVEIEDIQQGVTKWGYFLTPDDLVENVQRRWPPSVQLGRQHAQVTSPSLDHWKAVLTEPGALLAVCAPFEGNSLVQWMSEGKRFSLRESIGIIRQVASNLARLHQAGLVHGNLTPATVLLCEQGSLTLRRDPLYPPTSPYFHSEKGVLGLTPNDRFAATAPELAIPNTPPSIQTDIYALGVLWGTLLLGRTPWPITEQLDGNGWKKVHQVVPIQLPSNLPEPLKRCAQHLVAKNPSARFPDIDAFLKALDAIVVIPPETPVVHEVTDHYEAPPDPDDSFAEVFQPRSTLPAAPKPIAKKQKGKPAWMVPALLGGVVLLFGGITGLLLMGSGTRTSPTPPPVAQTPNTPPVEPTVEPEIPISPIADRFNVLTDDGNLLWAPPTAGEPYSLELFPPGVESVAFFSKKAWEGNDPLSTVQPWIAESIESWKEYATKLPLLSNGSVSGVAIALVPEESKNSFAVVTRYSFESPVEIQSIRNRLSDYSPKKGEGGEERVLTLGEMAVAFDRLSLAPSGTTRYMTIGPVGLIESMVETGGGAVPLRRQLEVLLLASDRESDLFVLAAPSFLMGYGRGLLESAPMSLPIAKEFFGDSVQGVSFRANFNPSLYGEWRMVLSDATMVGRATGELKNKLEGLPNVVERNLVETPSPPYWRAVANRFPQMLRSLVRNTRFGVEEGQVVANAYLPSESLGNLVVGTWMSLQGATSNGSTSGPKPEAVSKSTEELLSSPISISFDQESLEMGLAAIASEFNGSVLNGEPPLSFTINGGAFQKEGITQNQQVRSFQHSNAPLREVLTDLVRRANPVTTVRSPKEKDQKVVWILVEANGEKRIELTTRVWAEANGVALPSEF